MARKLKAELDLDTAAAQRKAKRITRDVHGIGRAATKTGGRFTALGGAASRGLGSTIAGLTGAIAGFAGLQAGIRSTIADLERLDALQKRTAMSLGQAFAAAGDLPVAPEMRRFLATEAPKAGVGVQEAVAAYSELRGALPMVPVEEIQKLLPLAMRPKLAGYDPARIAANLGQIWKFGKRDRIDPQFAARYAVLAEEAMGRHGTRFGRGGWRTIGQFTEAGLGDVGEALGFALASFQAEQGAEGLAYITQRLMVPRDLTKVKDAEVREFYKLGPKARMARYLAEPELRRRLHTETERPIVAAVLAQDPQARIREMRQQVGGLLIDKRIEQAWRDKEWAEEMAVQGREAQAEWGEAGRGGGRFGRELRAEQAELRLLGVPPVIRAPLRALGWAKRVFGADEEADELKEALEEFGPTPTPARDPIPPGASIINYNIGNWYGQTPSERAANIYTRQGPLA